MRVVTYRRSFPRGSDLALDWQERTLTAFLAANPGWEHVGDYVDLARDPAERPELARLLADADAGGSTRSRSSTWRCSDGAAAATSSGPCTAWTGLA